jgi:hypothetical protein
MYAESLKGVVVWFAGWVDYEVCFKGSNLESLALLGGDSEWEGEDGST